MIDFKKTHTFASFFITQTDAETGSDENEYALRGETGTIRVTTSNALPEVDTWYSVTGEVAFNPSEGEE